MRWRQLKHFCEGPPQYGLNTSADAYVDEGVRLLRTTDIQRDGSLSSVSDAVLVAPEQVGPRYQLQRGDLLFSRAGSLGRCFRVGELSEPMTFAGYLVRFRPTLQTDPRYLEYCAAARFFQAHIESDAITSTISNFNAERYANLPLPNLSESAQRAIADFLDTETARIDALITRKRRMIELLSARWLEAARTVLTLGHRYRNPLEVRPADTPPAGVEPAKLAWVARFGGGTTPSSGNEDYYGGRIPWVLTGDLDDGDVTTTSRTVTEVAMNDHSALKLHAPGSLVVAMYGATIGKLGFLQIPSTVNQACCVITPTHRVDPGFLFLYLRAFRAELIDLGRGSGQPNISQEAIRSLRLPLPPVDVQCRVSIEVRRTDEHRRNTAVMLEKQIALLQEHRQALITASVTGELDVPGVAA